MADATQVAPHVYKTVLENDQVRVLEVRMAAGDKTEMHSHPAVVAVMLEGGKARFEQSDGESVEMELPSGEAMYLPAVEHTTENVGSTPVHGFLIELK
jgi:quercetin dioxygenase-like cupin family protein